MQFMCHINFDGGAHPKFASRWKNTKKDAEHLAIECGKLQEDIETLQDQVMDLELDIGMLTQDENPEDGIGQPQTIVNISDMEEE
ncbi:unnamed protein product [Prunus armeniaca]|uniref:Uncharacterized protein n=1 Tax=Prunus armeniaca TaxID=36596 RepID=A0A6J5UJM2_PRUAR|nr:unnamed protein product [Prunus armeniaca]